MRREKLKFLFNKNNSWNCRKVKTLKNDGRRTTKKALQCKSESGIGSNEGSEAFREK